LRLAQCPICGATGNDYRMATMSEDPPKNTSEAPSERAADYAKAAENPIAAATTSLMHKLRDFAECADCFVPAAEKMQADLLSASIKQITDATELLRSGDQHAKVVGLKQVLDWTRKSDRAIHAKPSRLMRESLYIGMFSAFDAFTGDLLRAIFQKKPELFRSLNRTVDVATIIGCSTLDDLKRSLLEDEIETFRRDSYVDQFGRLESLFAVKLRGFSRCPAFVECTQRRNLFTHCDGVVTDQYLNVCKGAGLTIDAPVGKRLDVDLKYLKQSTELLMEVGLKLGQTLWRKVFPNELKQCDASLNKEIYDLLLDENWDRAFVFSEFAIQQSTASDDVMRKVFAVNHTIAAKFGGQIELASKLLSHLDWSGAALEFQLAKAVLEDQFDEAARLMLRLGKNGQLVDEHSYHGFPLFRTFRLQDVFLRTYEKIYGYPFADKVQQTAEASQEHLQQSASQKLAESESVISIVPPPDPA
jgi:hypothetical protein